MHNKTKSKYFNAVLVILTALYLFVYPGCSKYRVKDVPYNPEKIEKAIEDYKSTNWGVRIQAIRTLQIYSKSKAQNKIELIFINAAYDKHPQVQYEAIQGLRVINTATSRLQIRKIARETKNNNLKWYCLRALVFIKDPIALPLFLKGLNDEDWLIRETSIYGINILATNRDSRDLVPYILKGFNDSSKTVQLTAIKTVLIRDSRIYSKLISYIQKNKEKNNRLLKVSLTSLLGYKIDKKARSVLIGLLTHPNRDVRIAALRVLKEDQRLRENEED